MTDEREKNSLLKKLRENTVFGFIVAIVVYVLLGLLLWRVLDWYIAPGSITDDASKAATARKDLFQALGLIMAGLAGGIGVYFTWRNLRLTREELELTRKGQVTERFAKAIDQLKASDKDGKPQIATRVAGIYVLESIAKEFEKEYYRVVVELLTAYVRENAPWPRKGDSEEKDSQLLTYRHRRLDIQEVLSVLARREHSYEKGEDEGEDKPIHLENTDLRFGDLRGANLKKARLQKAILKGARLRNANLEEARLRGAKLKKASLPEASLEKADLCKAKLKKANLRGARLRATNLKGADLQGADLQGANLEEANLRKAKLERAELQEANLEGVDLRDTDLREVHGLTQKQLDQAIGDTTTTKIPEDLHYPMAWSKSANKQTDGNK